MLGAWHDQECGKYTMLQSAAFLAMLSSADGLACAFTAQPAQADAV